MAGMTITCDICSTDMTFAETSESITPKPRPLGTHEDVTIEALWRCPNCGAEKTTRA